MSLRNSVCEDVGVDTWNVATLCVYSETLSVADISAALGMSPTEAADIGDPTRSGLAGRPLQPRYLTYQRTTWLLSGDPTAAEGEDGTEFASLRALLGTLRGREDAVRGLRDTCEVVVRWAADTGSVQGGFAMHPDVISALASLGCALYGNVYSHEAEDEDDDGSRTTRDPRKSGSLDL